MKVGERYFGTLNRYWWFDGTLPQAGIPSSWWNTDRSYCLQIERVEGDFIWYSSYIGLPDGQLLEIENTHELRRSYASLLKQEIQNGTLQSNTTNSL